MQKIVTYLWFNTEALEAATFYTSVFKNSKIVSTMGPKDKPMGVTFELEGQQFIALNGGPQFQFTPAISLFVNCVDQQEVDDLWSKLTADGGAEEPCGWLRDKYGLSWQIIPTQLGDMLNNPDPQKAERAMQAMLKMKKIVIKDLESAVSNT